jgi:hypothetical protein
MARQDLGPHGFENGSGQVRLTYYFYLLDEDLGLMYVRVPTWLPCRLQIYFNGHHALARQLRQAGIDCQMEDNAFVHIADWPKAQELADAFAVERWEAKFHALARRFCPVAETFRGGYYSTVMQVEYALDLVFQNRATLAPLYEEISRQAVLAVRVGDLARFWGKHYSPEAEAQSDFKTLVEGTRIKHALGRQALKMYDKGRVLRLEATSNDITFFRHHRKVVHRDGREEYKNAALKKSIYSLSDVRPILHAACLRYLDFIGTLRTRLPAATTSIKSAARCATRSRDPGAASTSSSRKISASSSPACAASSSLTA